MIRDAKTEDLEFVNIMLQEAFGQPHINEEGLLVHSSRKYMIYEENGNNIGCLSYVITLDVGELEYVYVDYRHRRKGIASKLLKRALEIMKKDCNSILLEVRESNKAAIELYKKHGFKEFSRREKYYVTEDGIMMGFREE